MRFLVDPEPVAQLFRHGFEHPVGEHSREVGSFDEVNELARLDHSGRPSPPGQRLRPHTPAVGEGDGGEVFQKELPLGQTITDRIKANHVALPCDTRQRDHPPIAVREALRPSGRQ